MGNIIGEGIAAGINILNTYASWLVPLVVGTFTPLMVMTGMHYGLIPIGINNIATAGIIRHIALLPNEIIESAKVYDPAKITRYSITLATLFHKFYNACHVNVEDKELMKARLALCLAVKQVLGNVLSLLKITTPESM